MNEILVHPLEVVFYVVKVLGLIPHITIKMVGTVSEAHKDQMTYTEETTLIRNV